MCVCVCVCVCVCQCECICVSFMSYDLVVLEVEGLACSKYMLDDEVQGPNEFRISEKSIDFKGFPISLILSLHCLTYFRLCKIILSYLFMVISEEVYYLSTVVTFLLSSAG